MSGDVNWSSVSLLLHLDGSNGATSTSDSGPIGHALTFFGNAQLSTSGPGFGTASLLLDGSGDYLRAEYHAGLHLSTGDFTIECFVKAGATGGSNRPLMLLATSAGTYAWELWRHSGGYMRFLAYDDTNTAIANLQQTAGENVGDGSWHHVAVTRSGNTFRLFVDGNQRATGTSANAIRASATAPSYRLVIGSNPNGAGGLAGNLDEIRITAGVARYTAAFTPPAAAFPDGPPPVEARARGGAALGVGAALAWSQAARVSGASALGAGAALAWSQSARVAGGTALGRGAAAALQSNVYALGGSALGQGRPVLWWQSARVQGGSALGAGKAQAHGQSAFGSGRTALGAGLALLFQPQTIRVAGGSALGAGKVRAYNDFTSSLDTSAPLRYVADLITPTGVVRVPISSWQATLQLDQACYGQMVVPAVFELLEAVTSATEFVVYRRGRTLDGGAVEQMMLRCPIETRSLAQGARNYTATLAGYSDAFPGETGLPAAMTRTLQGVRSVTEDSGGIRLRADVDWLLRPGMTAQYGATNLAVSFINYYVPGSDQYMDIGERA